jgi:chromosome segregation ATPase
MIDLDIFGRGRIRELEYDKKELQHRINELERTVRAQQYALNRNKGEINELTRKLNAARDILEHEHEKVQVLERMVLAGDKARRSLGDKLKAAEAECARLREAQHEPERDEG